MSMFRLICRKFIQNGCRTSQECRSNHNVCFIHTYQSLKSNSNMSNSTNYDIPTVSYLVEKCGLSLDSAILASTKIYRNIESTEKPDSVLELFKTYGFTQTQIANLITKCPRLILADSVKAIKPKFEYFDSIGLSKSDIAKAVDSNPYMLRRSLRNRIIPLLDYLKRFLHTNDSIVAVLRECTRFNNRHFLRELEHNIATLRHHSVPEPSISKFIMYHSKSFMRKNDRFKEMVKAVDDMGFYPNTGNFVLAIRVVGSMTKSSWEKKVKVYKTFGLSEEDIISAFKLQPCFMRVSEEKIRKLMDFYLNELRLQPSDVSKRPNLMLISLEKRIIPRCSVLQVLLLKGLIEKDLNLMTDLVVGNTYFENKYVTKYQKKAPEVLKAYQGELGDSNFERLRALLRS